MGFDQKWFNELRQLTDKTIDIIIPKSFRPTVDELKTHDLVNQKLLNTTLALVKAFDKTGYPFSPLFRVYPKHICNFPRGKAFRKQWNIGFWAGDDPTDDFARVGIGFSLNKEMSEQGIDEYSDFIMRVASEPNKFDHTFQKLGSYVEPNYIFTIQPLSKAILSDQPNLKNDWRFFGKCMRYNSESDRAILHSMDMFVKEAISVFDIIKNNGFA